MIRKEEYYHLILEKISTIFSELEFIGQAIRYELENGNPNNLSLKLNEVNYYNGIILNYSNHFKNSLLGKSDWEYKKRVDYSARKLSSFFRQFESVFFGTERWYQRVVLLMEQLSKESRELDRLLEMNDDMC